MDELESAPTTPEAVAGTQHSGEIAAAERGIHEIIANAGQGGGRGRVVKANLFVSRGAYQS